MPIHVHVSLQGLSLSRKTKSRTDSSVIGAWVIESSIGVAKLPQAPRLQRLLIQEGQIAHISFRDIIDCSYVFGVDAERLHRQVIGFEILIPKRWMKHVDAWHYTDLLLGSAVSSVNPHDFCQLAIAGEFRATRTGFMLLRQRTADN